QDRIDPVGTGTALARAAATKFSRKIGVLYRHVRSHETARRRGHCLRSCSGARHGWDSAGSAGRRRWCGTNSTERGMRLLSEFHHVFWAWSRTGVAPADSGSGIRRSRSVRLAKSRRRLAVLRFTEAKPPPSLDSDARRYKLHLIIY